MQPPITNLLVAACGNVMASDDAFGPLVAHELRHRSLPGVDVIDLDIRPAALLDHLAGRTGLILVDAAHAPDAEPGEVLDIDWFDPKRPELVNDDAMSTHGLSIASQLELAQRLGMLPERVRLIAAVVEPHGVGDPVSLCLARQIITAVNLVVMHAERWSASILEYEHA